MIDSEMNKNINRLVEMNSQVDKQQWREEVFLVGLIILALFVGGGMGFAFAILTR